MKPIPLYSLVIFPTREQSDLVKFYKQLLRNLIRWFGSANAAAHITVMNFDNEAMLALHLPQVREFCKTVAVAHTVAFNAFGAFGDRTFFIAPDSTSKKYLNRLILDFHHYLGFKPSKVEAHMSIARGLDKEKMNGIRLI
jgi:hypothetical protein